MTTSEKKITALRKEMSKNNLDAYIILSSDVHQSEYVAKHWQSRAWFSGFSGSAGVVLVTADFAGLWTDSRYFIQAEEELQGSGIQLIKLKIPHAPEYIEWLFQNLKAGSKIGVDGQVVSVSLAKNLKDKLSDKNMELHFQYDLISKIWKNRPTLPQNSIFSYDFKYSGQHRHTKLKNIRKELQKKGADAYISSALDSIAWLFNFRGNDIKYSPVAIAFAVVDMKTATLFIESQKVPKKLQQELISGGVEIKNYRTINEHIAALKGQNIYYDPQRTSQFIADAIPKNSKHFQGIDIAYYLKAIKNKTEIAHFKQVMISDGIAMVKFLMWLEENISKQKITELSAAKKLREFRSIQNGFVSESFTTIAAYGKHGAIVHYSPKPKTDAVLRAKGLFLLDSGGQYRGGTTDLTRTIFMGKVTQKAKKDYTLVLKGHINLAKIQFPEGTKGHQLDILARKALWNRGLDYGHGTGHGVGAFLNVHEGPHAISPRGNNQAEASIQAGMISSNEPGMYREGKYGIRIENLVLAKRSQKTKFAQFLKFETITLCPIDISLIDKSLLNIDDIIWLNKYHKKVFRKLAPFLNETEQNWLRYKTREI